MLCRGGCIGFRLVVVVWTLYKRAFAIVSALYSRVFVVSAFYNGIFVVSFLCNWLFVVVLDLYNRVPDVASP